VNVSAVFIRRPVMTTMVMSALVVFGFAAYFALPVSELPNVDFPTIRVSASSPGADPQTMAAAVATPLERQFSAIAGVTSMSSVSTTGSTNITLQFDLSRDIDAAAQDVQTAISQSVRRLPQNMPTPPSLRKVNPADFAIIYLALSADRLPLPKLDEYAETRVAQEIATIPGVAQVLVFGSHKYAVRIELNPYALAARGLSLTQVADAIQAGNTNLPTGTLSGSTRTYTVQADAQLTDAAAYNGMVIAQRNGAPLRLSDVGTALDSTESDKQLTTFFDNTAGQSLRPAIVLAVKRQPGANTVQVSRAVRARLAELTRQAPGDATIRLLYDRADFINGSIHEVKFTLALAICLVVAVIFLFLRNARATLISALALPTSLVGTFALMRVLGFSLDNLSLMAITLAVGFVVDDAIVVLENVVRYRERGEGPMDAALVGTREIGFTVISMTLSLVAVFIPITFMGGLVGRLFQEFALTVTIAILISGVVSLTLTPMLCSRLLRHEEQHGRLYLALERAFEAVRGAYGRTLAWSVDHWGAVLGLAAGLLGLTFYLFAVVPKGFIPREDTGQIIADTKAPEGVSFDQLQALQAKVAHLVQQNPNVAAAMSSAGQGGGGVSGGNIGRMFIRLKPQAERDVDAEQVIQQLRKAVAPVKEMQVYFQNPPAIRIGSLGGSGEYQYVLQGPDVDELDRAAADFEPLLSALPGVEDVSSSLELSNPQVNVNILRDTASALGVSAERIQATLAAAYGGNQVSTIYGATDEFPVIMELGPRYQDSIEALNALYVPTDSGGLVPLRAVADVTPGVGPLSVSHYGQLPAVTFSFNLAPGVSLGEATTRIDTLARSRLPADLTGTFTGNAQTFRDSMVGLPVLLLITVLVIYMVLAILYEHFVHPITILTALPLAMVGALVTLILFKQELNIFSFVGLILLVGLVKKNGIIMVDFALHIRRQQDLPAREAIIEACLVRFRPIMMTTMAAILGTLPIALGTGMGAEARRPLGIAVVGGLVFSQMLTLYVTPAFYVAMEQLAARRGRRAAAPPGSSQAPKPPWVKAIPEATAGDRLRGD
jgi:hydrophobe/amphiphile efflux-1 (HAE1) family protein